MGKYGKFGRHLANQNINRVKYSFKEIEDILGFSLPDSARLYRPWWANDITHVQASDGWLNYEWNVDYIDMENQTVGFHKFKGDEQKQVYNKEEQISPTTPAKFEDAMRSVMSKYYKKNLFPGQIEGVPKLFDFTSEDKKIAGDAKYFTMVRGESLPPAKFSVIAEHVWLLEKIDATNKFLVFGNDRRVPAEWLKRYGRLVKDVEFFFYDNETNRLDKLN